MLDFCFDLVMLLEARTGFTKTANPLRERGVGLEQKGDAYVSLGVRCRLGSAEAASDQAKG
jgi:hypothetical protein